MVNKKRNALLDELKSGMDIVEEQEEKIVKPKSSRPKNVPWYPPNDKVKRELKLLAVDEETSMSALLTEGIDLLFKSKGKRSIKELTS